MLRLHHFLEQTKRKPSQTLQNNNSLKGLNDFE